MPAFKILVEATPGSAALCGFCKRLYPGPNQDHCGAFDGRRLEYVHQINDYVRLPECIAAEKAQGGGGGE